MNGKRLNLFQEKWGQEGIRVQKLSPETADVFFLLGSELLSAWSWILQEAEAYAAFLLIGGIICL